MKAIGGVRGEGEGIDGATHSGEDTFAAGDIAGYIRIDGHKEDTPRDDLLVIGFPIAIGGIVDTGYLNLVELRCLRVRVDEITDA